MSKKVTAPAAREPEREHSMSNIIFDGATIRSADLRHDKTGVYCRLRMMAALSQAASDAMEWTALPAFVDETKLTGHLTARSLVLTPNATGLQVHELKMEGNEMSDFRLYRVKQYGEIQKELLHFLVRVNEPGAIACAEAYLRLVGKEQGALRVHYARAPAGGTGGELESAGVSRRRK
jgi:hypothetical protein